MITERNVLYGDVVAGDIETAEEFRQRLSDIESLETGGDEPQIAVGRAVQAFDALLREAPSRHHQLELLREALGIT
jgi:hypothetical protein